VDGKKIKLVNIETKEVITGEEAFNNTKLLQGEFNIICSDEYSGDFNPVKLNLTSFHPRTIGEIGAACSHKKIWQEIVTKGYKNTLILEDDANFIAGFKKRLDNVMNNLPLDYEFVYLFAINIGDSYSIKNKDKILQTILRITDKKRENKFVKQARRNITSAVGYIVTQEGAQKLLDGFKNYYRVDKNIIELIENNKLIAYVTKPLLLDACLAQNKECETTIGTFPSHGRLSSDIVGK
jgi:GR25 family glycosyltransferase involved in LPS biosynthesis